MLYKGTNIMECIHIASEYDAENEYCINMMKVMDENVFYVTTDYDDDWYWAFYLDGVANYEMVKHAIMDVAFDCDDIEDYLDMLDCVFADTFETIIVEYEHECECGHDECNGTCCDKHNYE